MVKAIFWDNDGILVDTEPLYYRATRESLSEIGLTLHREEFIRISLQEGRSAFDLARDHGHPTETLEKLRQQRNRRYSQLLAAHAEALPHVEDTLRQLQGQCLMAIVTSSLTGHFETIHQRTGLLPFFDFVLTREQYSKTKPHPEPYLTALKRSRLKQEDCIVVEDSERGLAAAHAAGLRCVVIPTELTRGGEFSKAFAILPDLRELPALLSSL